MSVRCKALSCLALGLGLDAASGPEALAVVESGTPLSWIGHSHLYVPLAGVLETGLRSRIAGRLLLPRH